MGISAITGFSGMNQYRISSINGNPSVLKPVERVEEDNAKGNKALVIAQKEDNELYVKDYGEVPAAYSTAVGGFADLLNMQNIMQEQITNTQNQSRDSFNDMIGMMGYQNRLREQLTGIGFVEFA